MSNIHQTLSIIKPDAVERNLSEEIADVEVMINLLKETGIADEEVIAKKKKAKYEKYYGKNNT